MALSYVRGDRIPAVVATRPIDAHAEVCLSYVDVAQAAPGRRADLKHYGFHCGCKRCVEEDAIVAAAS